MKITKSFLLTIGLMLSLPALADRILLQGEFVTVTPGDDVEGSVSIVETKDHRRFVVLGEDFASEKGPDLHVVLHEELVPSSYKEENSLDLGELKMIEGKQYYLIPEDTDLNDFKAVVIWCQDFDVTFGSAELK